MQWTDLEPIVKIVPRVQAAVYVNKDGKPRIRLSFSEAFLNDTGHPSAATVQFGTDGTVAKLRLVFGKTGKFAVSEIGKGGARVDKIPAAQPVPDGAREAEPCEVESVSAKEAVIILPLAGWEKQLAPARPISRPAQTAPVTNGNGSTETRKHPDIPLSGDKFDAVTYLANKGVKISRVGDGYMEAGQRRSKADILTTVNRYRRAAELPALMLADLA